VACLVEASSPGGHVGKTIITGGVFKLQSRGVVLYEREIQCNHTNAENPLYRVELCWHATLKKGAERRHTI
jgi:hypothetical protein